MAHQRPPLLPPFSSDTAIDYLLIAASIMIAMVAAYTQFLT